MPATAAAAGDRLLTGAPTTLRRATLWGLLILSAASIGLFFADYAQPFDSATRFQSVAAAAILAGNGIFALLLNVERSRRDVPRRRLGHRLMAVGIAILYLAQGIGFAAAAAVDVAPSVLVSTVPLSIGSPFLAVGLVLLCWPPGMDRHDLTVLILDGLVIVTALLVLWVGFLYPAAPQGDSVDAIATRTSLIGLFLGAVVVLVIAATSRRPGSLPVTQLALLQLTVLLYVGTEIVDVVGADDDSSHGLGVLLIGATLSTLAYRAFTVRPALETESQTTGTGRLILSLAAPGVALVLMSGAVLAHVAWVGPLPREVAFLTGATFVAGVLILAVFRVHVGRHEMALRTTLATDSLQQGARSQWFTALVGDSHDLVTVLDRSGRITYQTPSLEAEYGFPAGTFDGQELADLVDLTQEEIDQLMLQVLADPDQHHMVDLTITDSEGQPRDTETVITSLRIDGSEGFVLTTRDVTDHRLLRAQITETQLRDSVTGLNNRQGFLARLRQLMSADNADTLAVVLLDLADFRRLNDSRGNVVGDAILRQVAVAIDQLPDSVRAAGRLGADEFGLIVVADPLQPAIGEIDRSLRQGLQSLLVDGGPPIDVGFQIGYVIRAAGNDAPAELLERADLALGAARNSRAGAPIAYEKGMRSAMVGRLRAEADLREAIDDGQLVVHYQPVVDLAKGTMTAVEALVRMHSADGSLIPPGEFIAQAEQLGLIDRLGSFVLDTALRDLLVIEQAAGIPVRMAVNVSSHQLSPDLPFQVSRSLVSAGVAADRLVLEITESAIVDHEESGFVLADLRRLGCTLSIDDFGTGYSSLSYLVGLPVDELKIDRSFIHQLGSSERALALVRVLLQMSATLGLSVTAEGIETVEQADILKGMGCPKAQGYLFARPMPLAELVEHLRTCRAAFPCPTHLRESESARQ